MNCTSRDNVANYAARVTSYIARFINDCCSRAGARFTNFFPDFFSARVGASAVASSLRSRTAVNPVVFFVLIVPRFARHVASPPSSVKPPVRIGFVDARRLGPISGVTTESASEFYRSGLSIVDFVSL